MYTRLLFLVGVTKFEEDGLHQKDWSAQTVPAVEDPNFLVLMCVQQVSLFPVVVAYSDINAAEPPGQKQKSVVEVGCVDKMNADNKSGERYDVEDGSHGWRWLFLNKLTICSYFVKLV